MSDLLQVEQTTNVTTVAAGTQLLYPKVGGQFFMASDMVEKQLLDSRSSAQYHTTLELNVLLIGGF